VVKKNSEIEKREIRILMLEDVPADAELTERELRKERLAFLSKRVETREDFLKEIKDFAPDLILADYSLPAFDGLSALAIAQKQNPELPFILVSGAIGEELAVEILKNGATDYVIKNQLARLVPAVKRALQEARDRAERKRAEEELHKSEEDLKKRVKELEDFYDMAVGRELRMIELKEELESLKNELSRYKKVGGVQDD
jgi:DNA-binding NtrC family response regulator